MSSTMTYLPYYLLLGSISGLMAGLLGIGGGLIVVPVLLFLFELQNFSSDIAMHMSIGTSPATVTITSVASTLAHHMKGTVEWPLWLTLSPGLIIGSLLGAAIADFLPGDILRIIFACFELLAAFHIVRNSQPQGLYVPHWVLFGVIAVGIGTVSALLGISGGLIVLVFLLWIGIPIKNAVSTSAATGFPVAFTGTIGFIFLGFDVQSLPHGSNGYVYWPALMGIVVTSVITAPLGAKLTHALSPTALRRIFTLFLSILGVIMLVGF